MPKSTMNEISYGISNPRHLFEKLIFEGSKIEGENPHPYDLFNFFVTAAVLNEWIYKYYPQNLLVKSLKDALITEESERLPREIISWIISKQCLPNKGCDERRHVFNALKICWDTANASKHYHWSKSGVSEINNTPVIKGFYQYFFTSREPGIYIEYSGEYYAVTQLREILNQFYSGFLSYLESSA